MQKELKTEIMPAASGTLVMFYNPMDKENPLTTKVVIAWEMKTVEEDYDWWNKTRPADEHLKPKVSVSPKPITADPFGIRLVDYIGEPDAPYVIIDPVSEFISSQYGEVIGIMTKGEEPQARYAITKHLKQEAEDFGFETD